MNKHSFKCVIWSLNYLCVKLFGLTNNIVAVLQNASLNQRFLYPNLVYLVIEYLSKAFLLAEHMH